MHKSYFCCLWAREWISHVGKRKKETATHLFSLHHWFKTLFFFLISMIVNDELSLWKGKKYQIKLGNSPTEHSFCLLSYQKSRIRTLKDIPIRSESRVQTFSFIPIKLSVFVKLLFLSSLIENISSRRLLVFLYRQTRNILYNKLPN